MILIEGGMIYILLYLLNPFSIFEKEKLIELLLVFYGLLSFQKDNYYEKLEKKRLGIQNLALLLGIDHGKRVVIPILGMILILFGIEKLITHETTKIGEEIQELIQVGSLLCYFPLIFKGILDPTQISLYERILMIIAIIPFLIMFKYQLNWISNLILILWICQLSSWIIRKLK